MTVIDSPSGGGRGNSRYINQEVPTWENFLDLVLKKYLEKDIPILEKSRIYEVKDMHEVTVFH